jgi:hypothetical protein
VIVLEFPRMPQLIGAILRLLMLKQRSADPSRLTPKQMRTVNIVFYLGMILVVLATFLLEMLAARP